MATRVPSKAQSDQDVIQTALTHLECFVGNDVASAANAAAINDLKRALTRLEVRDANAALP